MASSVRRVVKVEVAGRRGDYHVTTLLTWIEELKGFLERELGAELEVSFRELDVEYPPSSTSTVRLPSRGYPEKRGT